MSGPLPDRLGDGAYSLVIRLTGTCAWITGVTMKQAGPVALVGSGEFLPQMQDVDRWLLNGRPQRAAFLPTAAGQEGRRSVQRWIDMGTAHYEHLGLEAVPVPVVTIRDANDPALAALLNDVGLIYLSGGNPGYLADTLRGSLVWTAIVSAWRSGSALAGCSAGAGALTRHAPNMRTQNPDTAGLGAVPHLAVIPHFDKMARWDPQAVDRMTTRLDVGVHLVGIDEDTALVGGPTEWVVMGRQSVHILSGQRKILRHGDTATLD
jgi:cyanophycinase